jgi:FKBP-type peptidyl-prolyl cis-trans isomerase SlyD
MTITTNSVVQFHYTLFDENGQKLESSPEDKPALYLHGHGNIIPGLEKAMVGKVKGDTFKVSVPPEEGYGQRLDNAIQRISIKHLQGAKKWKPGMIAWVQTEHGSQQVLVLKVGKFVADVDINHPLAGKTLSFEVSIIDERQATEDELAHGHAHGEGGHEH